MASDKQRFLDDLQQRLSELVRASPAADIERNLRAMLNQAFQRMELVTREEFDIQVAMLERLRERLNELERTVARLESGAEARADAEGR